MTVPLEITFRGMSPSPAVETSVRQWLDRLAVQFDRIQRCEVVIEVPHRSQQKGQTFRVRVELVVPDKVIEVARDPGIDHAHEDVYVAITDAFRAARRQLQAHAQIIRGEVKHHAG
jgi:ribosome-associated translation inhibitor RaiA